MKYKLLLLLALVLGVAAAQSTTTVTFGAPTIQDGITILLEPIYYRSFPGLTFLNPPAVIPPLIIGALYTQDSGITAFFISTQYKKLDGTLDTVEMSVRRYDPNQPNQPTNFLLQLSTAQVISISVSPIRTTTVFTARAN